MEVGVVWRLGLEAHLFKGLTTRQAACRTVQARVRSRVRCDSSPGAPPLCHTGGRQCPATKVPGRRVCKRAGQGKASAEATDLSCVHGSQQRAAQRGLCSQQRGCYNFFSHPDRICLPASMCKGDNWLGFARVIYVISENGRRGEEACNIVCFPMRYVGHARGCFNQLRTIPGVAAATIVFCDLGTARI